MIKRDVENFPWALAIRHFYGMEEIFKLARQKVAEIKMQIHPKQFPRFPHRMPVTNFMMLRTIYHHHANAVQLQLLLVVL